MMKLMGLLYEIVVCLFFVQVFGVFVVLFIVLFFEKQFDFLCLDFLLEVLLIFVCGFFCLDFMVRLDFWGWFGGSFFLFVVGCEFDVLVD